jgi:hypothetical protein
MKIAFVSAIMLFAISACAQTGPYDTALFSVQYPAGGHIRVHESRDSENKIKSVTHFYNARLPHRSVAEVDVTDYASAVFPEDRLETLFSKRVTAGFAPGFSASPITKAMLGGLQGYKQTVRGQLRKHDDLNLVFRWRLAVSQNQTRVWVLQTISPSDEDLPEAEWEKFFDSLKIK